MATTRAARSLSLENRAGCITPGVDADLVIFATRSADDPLLEILESNTTPGAVWSEGMTVHPEA